MNCLLFEPSSETISSGGADIITDWSGSDTNLIWVNISGELDEATRKILKASFGLHPLALQDASRNRHPPKIEEFSEYTFLIFKTLTSETVDINFSTLQNCMFVGPRFLITRTSAPCISIEEMWKKELAKPNRIRQGPDAVASRLMRLFVDRYLAILLQLESRLEAVESGLLDKVDDSVLAVVTGYKASLKRLRRIFLYHEQLLRNLRDQVHCGFSEERKHELNDVFEQQERAGSLTLLFYELASDLIDGYLSLSSHRLNQIMKVLTIVTVVFVPLGFLAGIYGMNFENMPELQSRSGYFILLGIMATIATTLLLSFRKKRWL
ncbi:MAG: magnesium/cobalt transporter CorA [Verrucomicrobiales bacterium]|nr:magnesium/cobalt transporter CorA [Verrucomicrobiales bacterium]